MQPELDWSILLELPSLHANAICNDTLESNCFPALKRNPSSPPHPPTHCPFAHFGIKQLIFRLPVSLRKFPLWSGTHFRSV